MIRTALLSLGLAILAGCPVRDPGVESAGTSSSDDASPSSTSGVEPTTSSAASTASTTSASTTSGASTTSCRMTCGDQLVALGIIRADLVFVLDKSSSMAGLWDHDADPGTSPVSRWSSLHRAVEQVLLDFEASLFAGVSLFPSIAATNFYGPEACVMADVIEAAIGPNNAAAILAAIPAADDKIDGADPGSAAIAAATVALLAGPPDHSRHIVYVTNSAANCGADAQDAESLFEVHDATLHERVQAAATAGITTHVVGVAIADQVTPAAKDGQPDGINNFDDLGQLAVEGGAPLPGPETFFNADDEAELTASLNSIVRAALPCSFTLDPAPDYPDYLEVQVGDLGYGTTQVDDCATRDGWHLVEGAKVELCGQTCLDFQTTGYLDVIYGCPPIPC